MLRLLTEVAIVVVKKLNGIPQPTPTAQLSPDALTNLVNAYKAIAVATVLDDALGLLFTICLVLTLLALGRAGFDMLQARSTKKAPHT